MTAPPAGRARWRLEFKGSDRRSLAYIATGHTAYEAHASAVANSRHRIPSFGECKIRRIEQ